MNRRHLLALLTAAGLLTACGKKPPKASPLPAGSSVLALGDSLTEGVGAGDSEHAWPSLLAQATGWHVVNAGVSGDTSAQALARLPELLDAHQPQLVIISIGGNDFLRQMSARTAQDNIRRMAQAATDSGAQALLVAVPQFSLLAAGTGRLSDHPLYAELARELDLPLHAGGWSAVLSDAKLRADSVHANAQGYQVFADSLLLFMRQHGWQP